MEIAYALIALVMFLIDSCVFNILIFVYIFA